MLYLFTHLSTLHPFIHVSHSDFFLESQTRIRCCARHFACVSCGRAEAAARCRLSARGDAASLRPGPPDPSWPVTTLTTRHEEMTLGECWAHFRPSFYEDRQLLLWPRGSQPPLKECGSLKAAPRAEPSPAAFDLSPAAASLQR